eukprot:3767648-Prymnesium_polylepis.1
MGGAGQRDRLRAAGQQSRAAGQQDSRHGSRAAGQRESEVSGSKWGPHRILLIGRRVLREVTVAVSAASRT